MVLCQIYPSIIVCPKHDWHIADCHKWLCYSRNSCLGRTETRNKILLLLIPFWYQLESLKIWEIWILHRFCFKTARWHFLLSLQKSSAARTIVQFGRKRYQKIVNQWITNVSEVFFRKYLAKLELQTVSWNEIDSYFCEFLYTIQITFMVVVYNL